MHTQTRRAQAQAARLRAKAHAADALVAANTRTLSPSRVREMPDAEGIPPRPKGADPIMKHFGCGWLLSRLIFGRVYP